MYSTRNTYHIILHFTGQFLRYHATKWLRLAKGDIDGAATAVVYGRCFVCSRFFAAGVDESNSPCRHDNCVTETRRKERRITATRSARRLHLLSRILSSLLLFPSTIPLLPPSALHSLLSPLPSHPISGVHQDEAAGPVGALRLSLVKARLAEQRSLRTRAIRKARGTQTVTDAILVPGDHQ